MSNKTGEDAVFCDRFLISAGMLVTFLKNKHAHSTNHIRFSEASNSHHAKPDERIYNKLMLEGGGGLEKSVARLVP